MESDRPVVLLAHAHHNKKKKGTQELRSLSSALQQIFPESSCLIQREGLKGAPWGGDVLGGSHHAMAGIHLVTQAKGDQDWWLNDIGGQKTSINWDTISLENIEGLSWVWIQGQNYPELAEKLLFAGAKIVISGNEQEAKTWYRHLANGCSVIEAWEMLEGEQAVHVIPADPFDYWAWCENRKESQPGSALVVLSSDQDFLHAEPFPTLDPPAEVPTEAAVPAPIELPVVEPQVTVVPEPEPEYVVSDHYDRIPRDLDQARREELEYRHPSPVGDGAELALSILGEEWEDFDVSEERIIEIINKQDFKFAPRRRILATAISACLGIALMMVGMWQMGWNMDREQMNRLAHFSTFSDSSAFRVLLLPFHQSADCDPENIWDETAVRDHLLSRPEVHDLNLEVSYITPGSCPERREDARRLAEIYNADLVVWGTAPVGSEDSLLNLSYVLAEGASDLDLRHLMANFRLADGYLGGSSESVVDQVLALGFFAHRQPRQALGYLDQSLHVPEDVAAWRELAIVLSLEDLHQPEEALERCESALDTFSDHESLVFHARRLRNLIYPDNSDGATPVLGMAPLSNGIASR